MQPLLLMPLFPLSDAEVIAKRILDLMNVKGITRENVASHLQAQTFSFPSLLVFPSTCFLVNV